MPTLSSVPTSDGIPAPRCSDWADFTDGSEGIDGIGDAPFRITETLTVGITLVMDVVGGGGMGTKAGILSRLVMKGITRTAGACVAEFPDPSGLICNAMSLDPLDASDGALIDGGMMVPKSPGWYG